MRALRWHERWGAMSCSTAARRSRSTPQGSLPACRQAESCWRRERHGGGPTPRSRAFAPQGDGAGAELLSASRSRGGGQCVEYLFDAIDHGWLVQFIEHRIADRRVVRLIQKWLRAGVLEDGTRRWSETGTPQGGSASPLLANVYLHYAFDLWAHHWRRKQAQGDVVIVRFADDIVVGFQHRAEAERFRAELEERFRKFNLELHAEKTRLLEFGPFAADNRRRRGQGKPETFDFLGFTHICVKKRSNGMFTVLRQTARKKLQAKLSEVKTELRRRMHDPVPELGKWLAAVVRGHMHYYGVPMNNPALHLFRFQVGRLWHRTLSRRSQNGRVLWERMRRLISCWLPQVRTYHPYPLRRLGVIT